MSIGVQTENGFRYEALHLRSGFINLAVGDLVTAFDKADGNEFVTGKVAYLEPRGIVISPAPENSPPILIYPAQCGLKAAFT